MHALPTPLVLEFNSTLRNPANFSVTKKEHLWASIYLLCMHTLATLLVLPFNSSLVGSTLCDLANLGRYQKEKNIKQYPPMISLTHLKLKLSLI